MNETTLFLLERFGIRKLPPRMPVEVPGLGRDDLAGIFAELGFTKGAEIGVKEADYSDVLLRDNPSLTLYSVDPWLVREDYRDNRGQERFDEFEATARGKLAKYGPRSIIAKTFSLQFCQEIPDRSLDFVYIDGHHSFQACTNDIVELSKKVRLGGIISGHDYARYKYGADIAVKEVVDAYTAAYRIRPWFVLGRKAHVEGETRDKHRSFLWVNEQILTPASRL